MKLFIAGDDMMMLLFLFIEKPDSFYMNSLVYSLCLKTFFNNLLDIVPFFAFSAFEFYEFTG